MKFPISSHPEAYSWCLMGAALKVGHVNHLSDVLLGSFCLKLSKNSYELNGFYYAEFNDLSLTTHSDVLNFLDTILKE